MFFFHFVFGLICLLTVRMCFSLTTCILREKKRAMKAVVVLISIKRWKIYIYALPEKSYEHNNIFCIELKKPLADHKYRSNHDDILFVYDDVMRV